MLTGAVSCPKGIMPAFETHQISLRYFPGKRTLRSMKAKGVPVPQRYFFLHFKRDAPNPKPLFHGPSLAIKQKFPVFEVPMIKHDMGKAFSDQKRVDHISVFQKYVCQEPAMTIAFFLIIFQFNANLLHQLKV